MNFAGKKLNGFYKTTGDLSVRERRLLAENRKLKKKNKRLSGAMLYLVSHIEARLPIWSTKAKPVDKDIEKPLPPTQENTRRKVVPPARPKKKKIIGKVWMPEHLDKSAENRIEKKQRKNILSVPRIFADKEPMEPPKPEEKNSEVVKFPTPEETKPDPPQVIELAAEPEILQAEEMVDTKDLALTPKLDPEEVNLLAAPIKDQKVDVIHPHPSEIIGEQDDLKTSAKDASMAYLAVSVVAQPVPKSDVITVPDESDLSEADMLERQVARQNEMMRAAMLRRVNRLRW
ncbi:MAG: hypothetical protein JKY04_08270 [Sneathiella sp.]|nr:hypothetical protein [Sneathiella sp.]